MSSPQTQYAPLPPRRSFAGPVVLIALGVLFLLGNMHVISWGRLAYAFARWWPVLIIVWGLIKLVEYWDARRKGYTPSRIGVGGFFLVFFLIVIGLSARGMQRVNWSEIDGDIQIGPFGNSFFGQIYTFEGQQEQEFKASRLILNSDRGAVNVITWDQPTLKLVMHKQVRAQDEGDSKRVDAATQPQITTASDVVTVNLNTNGAGNRFVETDVEVFVPRKASVEISTRRGDVTIRDREGDIRVNNSHAGIVIENITGNVILTNRHGDVRALKVSGDVKLDGRLDDVSVSEIGGSAQMSGEFFGNMSLARVSKGVNFHSSRTDMDFAKLDGDLSLDSGNLRARSLAGPVRLSTRAKDITLEEVIGDVRVENRNGAILISAAKPGQIEVDSTRGDVTVNLPANTGFHYDVRAVRGDIHSNVPDLKPSGDKPDERHEKVATGTVGTGAAKVSVKAQYGDVSINRS